MVVVVKSLSWFSCSPLAPSVLFCVWVQRVLHLAVIWCWWSAWRQEETSTPSSSSCIGWVMTVVLVFVQGNQAWCGSVKGCTCWVPDRPTGNSGRDRRQPCWRIWRKLDWSCPWICWGRAWKCCRVRKMASFPCRSFSRRTAMWNNIPSENLIWRRRDISSPLRWRIRCIRWMVCLYCQMFLTSFCKSHTDRKDSCFLLPLSLWTSGAEKWTMHQRPWIYSLDHLVAYPITTKHGAP